jgi:hypothetical protein
MSYCRLISKEQILDYIFVAVILFIALVMQLRKRRLFMRLQKEEPKELREVIIIKVSLSENDASQLIEEPEPEPAAV